MVKLFNINKISIYIIVLLLFGIIPDRPAYAAQDELVIGITQYPSNLHPNIDSMMAKTYVLAMTRRPFTTYNADWEIICLLCTRLPTLENGLAKKEITPNGKQGIALTYTIQPQATWGDGVAVTTKDVVFTWQVGRHEKSGVSNMELYRSLYKIDVVDDKTFTLHFDKLTFDYNAINDFELIPAHIDQANFADPEKYKYRTAYDTDSLNPGLYFGPYRISQIVKGSHIILEPNDSWWGRKPSFSRIVVKTIENTAALEANLLSGNIDMIAGELSLSIEQALALEQRHATKYRFLYRPGLVYEHIDLNLDNPYLADLRVRKALVMALDRKAISDNLFGGRQPVAHTSVNPLDWVHATDIPRYEFDPKQANQLLDQAGWNIKKSGIRHNAKGEKLSFEIMTTAGNRTRELVQQVLQSQWKAVGIDIRIRNEPARVFFGQTVTQRRFSAMAMFAWISSPESVPRTTLHSKEIPTADNNYAGQNYTGFRNPEMDTILESIELELDRNKRNKMWQQFQEIYSSELPVIPLYFRANPYILPKQLVGITPTGHQAPTTLWVENWRMNK